MSDWEVSILLPKIPVYFMQTTLSFGIGHMKSRLPSVVYFILHLYDENDEELFIKTTNVRGGIKQIDNEPIYKLQDKWVVDNTYSEYHQTFDIDKEFIDRGVNCQIEIRADNITSENPLYFNKLMFNEGDWDDYHIPNEVAKHQKISFNNSSYTNLYNDLEETYLQVIRPSDKKAIYTNQITNSSCTVLAPHLKSEQNTDSPINLFFEFINMSDQRIDVLR